MNLTWMYVLISVMIVSLVSVLGFISLFARKKSSAEFLLLLVSLSAGTLFGSAFLHLLPEAVGKSGFTVRVSLLVLAGVVVFFILEKFIHWHHCHGHSEKKHPTRRIALLNLLGDALHNLLDGLIIAGTYLVSIPAGIAATIAVILHEVPQEIADAGVLLYAGLSRAKALILNLVSAAIAILGAVLGLVLGSKSGQFVEVILPFAAGGFVYIAGSNLIPELHKECGLKDSFWHLFTLVLGILLVVVLGWLD